MPSAGFEPGLPVIKLLKTDALDQRFSNCGPRTTRGPRVQPLWSF